MPDRIITSRYSALVKSTLFNDVWFPANMVKIPFVTPMFVWFSCHTQNGAVDFGQESPGVLEALPPVGIV